MSTIIFLQDKAMNILMLFLETFTLEYRLKSTKLSLERVLI